MNGNGEGEKPKQSPKVVDIHGRPLGSQEAQDPASISQAIRELLSHASEELRKEALAVAENMERYNLEEVVSVIQHRRSRGQWGQDAFSVACAQAYIERIDKRVREILLRAKNLADPVGPELASAMALHSPYSGDSIFYLEALLVSRPENWEEEMDHWIAIAESLRKKKESER